jgi:hypothetical protein
MEPQEVAYLNFNIQLFLPQQNYAEFKPTGSPPDNALYQQFEVSYTGSNDTVKMLVKNTSNNRHRIIPAGTHVLAVNILQKCDGEKANDSANSTSPSALALELKSFPPFTSAPVHSETLSKSVLAVNTLKENGVCSDNKIPILDKLHS